jgi:hypothetical protein
MKDADFGSTPSNSSSSVIRRATVSLALSFASLMAYASIIENASTVIFYLSTVGALAAGIVSLTLALAAQKESKQKETGARDRLLVTASILVAIGYLVCLGIIAVNILVYRAL